MDHTLELRATAEGPRFYYREGREWKFAGDEGVKWITDAMEELADYAVALAADGKGDITGSFLTIVDGNAQSLVIERLSKKDVAKIERAFYEKALELIDISLAK